MSRPQAGQVRSAVAGKSEETSTHSPFGTGNVDFPSVLGALAPIWDGLEWCCFDFCFCPTTEADAKLAIPYVRDLLASA